MVSHSSGSSRYSPLCYFKIRVWPHELMYNNTMGSNWSTWIVASHVFLHAFNHTKNNHQQNVWDRLNGYIGMKWTGLSPLFPGTDDSIKIDKENWKHFLQIMLKCFKCCNWVIWNHQKHTNSHRAVLCIPDVLTSTSTISPRTTEYNPATGYIGKNSTLKYNGKNCESVLINHLHDLVIEFVRFLFVRWLASNLAGQIK